MLPSSLVIQEDQVSQDSPPYPGNRDKNSMYPKHRWHHYEGVKKVTVEGTDQHLQAYHQAPVVPPSLSPHGNPGEL